MSCACRRRQRGAASPRRNRSPSLRDGLLLLSSGFIYTSGVSTRRVEKRAAANRKWPIRASRRPDWNHLRDPLPAGDYYALVSRSDRRPDCDVYHWAMPLPLPTIPVPLRPPDPDVGLNLQAVFDVVYDKGQYRREID